MSSFILRFLGNSIFSSSSEKVAEKLFVKHGLRIDKTFITHVPFPMEMVIMISF